MNGKISAETMFGTRSLLLSELASHRKGNKSPASAKQKYREHVYQLVDRTGKQLLNEAGEASKVVFRVQSIKSTHTLELAFSCSDLIQWDKHSLSDPMVAVWRRKGPDTKWAFFDKTETIVDDHHPLFSKRIYVEITPNSAEQLCFKVYDADQPRYPS